MFTLVTLEPEQELFRHYREGSLDTLQCLESDTIYVQSQASIGLQHTVLLSLRGNTKAEVYTCPVWAT